MRGVEKPVYIEGTVYSSMAVAAKDCKLIDGTLRARVYSRSYKWREWRFARPTEHTEVSGETNKLKVVINGVIYASTGEAARVLKMNYSAVRARLKSESEEFKNWKYLNGYKRVKPPKITKDVVLMMDGVTYLTKLAAARALGITTGGITYYLQHPERYPNCYYWNFRTKEKVPY